MKKWCICLSAASLAISLFGLGYFLYLQKNGLNTEQSDELRRCLQNRFRPSYPRYRPRMKLRKIRIPAEMREIHQPISAESMALPEPKAFSPQTEPAGNF